LVKIGNQLISKDKKAWVSSNKIYIVETKGQEDLDVPLKMQRLRQWCEDLNKVQSDVKYNFVYVDQESFEKYKPGSFRELAKSFVEYKETTK
jgi:type III restriction enzyme